MLRSSLRNAALAVVLAATAAWGADVTGTWNFEVQTDAGSGNPTFVLKQNGDKLTGTYSGALGNADVRGTVKGDDILIEFETDAIGQKATVRYTGKLEGANSMKGKVVLGDYEGTFTATRKE